MITTNLTGNLGNHMWQYAVCRTIAEELGYEWGINPTPSHDYFNGANQMDFMDVDFGMVVSGIVNEYHEPWKTYHHVDAVNITMLNSSLYEIDDNTILIGDNGAKGGVITGLKNVESDIAVILACDYLDIDSSLVLECVSKLNSRSMAFPVYEGKEQFLFSTIRVESLDTLEMQFMKGVRSMLEATDFLDCESYHSAHPEKLRSANTPSQLNED